jgi:acyl-CoA thioesterase
MIIVIEATSLEPTPRQVVGGTIARGRPDNRHGRLVASAAQEGLIRKRQPSTK